MLNKFLCLGNNHIVKGYKVSQYQTFVRSLASFTARNILQETSDEAGTLLTRFAKHIAFELQKDTSVVPTVIRYADYFPITDTRYLQRELNKISPHQLPALIVFAFSYRASADPNKFASVLNELDATAIKLFSKMDVDTILRTLYAFLYLMPNWITRMDFYERAMGYLATNANAENTTKEKFVQICFYLGLEKNHKTQNDKIFYNFLNDHLETYLDKLSTLDLVTVASATFKTSTRVESETFKNRLKQELLKLSLEDSTNDALLVTLIKAMRFQRVRSKEICEHLKKYCAPDIADRLQIRGCIHLFAYFADNLYDDKSSIQPLVKQCLHRINASLKCDLQNENIRGKDIATFLWCCAQLNCSISKNDLKSIDMVLFNKIEQNEYRHFRDQLVDSCLSLWMLGYKSHDLIEEAVSLKLNARLNNKKDLRDLPKVESRLQVLLSAVAIEEPTWRFKNLKGTPEINIETPAPPYLLKDRFNFVDIANKIEEQPSVISSKLVCPINGINIPSILVSYKEPANMKVFIELLPEEQILQFSQSPMGVLSLKIRLLTSLGCKVVTLSPKEYKDESKSLDILALNIGDGDMPEVRSMKV
ncbi:uncharacterized protein LOC101460731 [Ceratitis capitata]|uniref:(Mediterranean fruit fly) hypothetical protein n=1 Tax=Ceratitis capitata TaxID=7213 RepID=W8BU39_CERCA|nr:uncharacterized protein LOC101460731 [Ceratitis capitata]CAD6997659.1 unnamed protein product [Ceratitis capitata]